MAAPDWRRDQCGAGAASAPPGAAWKVENGVSWADRRHPAREPAVCRPSICTGFRARARVHARRARTQCLGRTRRTRADERQRRKSGLYNSGITCGTGYQVNSGGARLANSSASWSTGWPEAIRRNVLWLDKGDEKFPTLRKKEDWNHLQVSFRGPHLQVSLNGTKICDVVDNPTDPAEARWKEAGPIGLQWPPASEGGGFDGYVKYRNIRIR